MLTSIQTNIPGSVFAKKLLEEINECCDHNVNLISFSDYYALRLFVRELSVDRIPNTDEHILYYFVYSRELDGNRKKEIDGNRMLVEDLEEYRSKKKHQRFKYLDAFIQALKYI